MPSRFEEAPEQPPMLTPQITEAVVERFNARQAERRRAEEAERERIADVRVQNLAQELGTTPDEVRALAIEEAHRLAQPRIEPRSGASRGLIHAAYLSALALVAAWGVVGRVGVPGLIAPATPAAVRGVAVAKKEPTREVILMSSALVTPPTGVKLTIVDNNALRTVVGPQGLTKRGPTAAAEIKAAICALLKYEEASYGTMLGWKEEGFTSPLKGTYTPYPAPGGWHLVEISSQEATVRMPVPDQRFASDFKDFKKALATALDTLVDERFLPRIQKGLDPERALALSESAELPKGFSLNVTSGAQRFHIQGGGPVGTQGFPEATFRKGLKENLRRIGAALDQKDAPPAPIKVEIVCPTGGFGTEWPNRGAMNGPQMEEFLRGSATFLNRPKPTP